MSTKISKGKRRHLLALCERRAGPWFDIRFIDIDIATPACELWLAQLRALDSDMARFILGVSP